MFLVMLETVLGKMMSVSKFYKRLWLAGLVLPADGLHD